MCLCETDRGKGKLRHVCVFNLIPGAAVNKETGEGGQSGGVCVSESVPDVNKRSPRCRGAAGSRAPPARRPCFHQSVTEAPCPPR